MAWRSASAPRRNRGSAGRATSARASRFTGGRGGGTPLSALRVQKVPVVIIQGRNDLHTPYEPAKAFFDIDDYELYVKLQAEAAVVFGAGSLLHAPSLEGRAWSSRVDAEHAHDALEPHIDARTMEIHHTKHHQTYVDKLNAIVEKIKSTK